jgi:RNA polymerase sigma-70 factor (ECF subfamily)
MQDIADDIIIQAAQGDLASFELIYKALAGFVYNVALRVGNSKEDAQEVTQEVFLIIHRKLPEFRQESSLKTWVYRITVNCAINASKKVSQMRNKTSEYDDSSKEAMVVGDVHKEMDKAHSSKIVEEILSLVNDEQRVCLVLRNMEGLSYEQIAQTLKISINTVRSRLKRAREKILATKRQTSYEYL